MLCDMLLCVRACIHVMLACSILYVVRKEGKGGLPREGDIIAIKYIGYLNNGKAFDINDGTVAGRKPTVFKLGGKQVSSGVS
jgi:FKBP-type peptidyl-prolyl cis-trans isomerase